MLAISELTAGYHGVPVLHGVSLAVRTGEFVTVLGANGAGKSTLMQVLMGLLPSMSGRVEHRGEDLLRVPAHERVSRGIAYVPEGRRVFPALTVEENLRAVNLKHSATSYAEGLDTVFTLFPRLKERDIQLAGTLSGGEQQMLALGRALMSRPSLLLADEISLGLAPIIVDQLFEVFRDLNDSGVSILLAEQNALSALEYADTAYVLETGSVTREARASDLLTDASIVESYLQEL
ncbi:ABC transporter ATP-binding protein [Intrasporangium sp.]|uniref:ABC transporter ATP-binding protein n=1 Tax=Intrasporangium sp. TaxID=1925024 RepID=UPI003221CA0D